jgi:hypothetical protein
VGLEAHGHFEDGQTFTKLDLTTHKSEGPNISLEDNLWYRVSECPILTIFNCDLSLLFYGWNLWSGRSALTPLGVPFCQLNITWIVPFLYGVNPSIWMHVRALNFLNY